MEVSAKITILFFPVHLVAELCEASRDLALVANNTFWEREDRRDGDGFGRKDSPRKRRWRLTQWGILH